MLEIIGDLWSYQSTHLLVVPSNIGWARGDRAVMGAGIAKQAAQRWPGLPLEYGRYCKQYKQDIGVVGIQMFFPTATLLMFPVKPLASDHRLSWQQPASLELIEQSTRQLVSLVDSYDRIDGRRNQVAIPRVGTGNGGLRWLEVKPILDRYLDDERFLLVSSYQDSYTEGAECAVFDDSPVEFFR